MRTSFGVEEPALSEAEGIPIPLTRTQTTLDFQRTDMSSRVSNITGELPESLGSGSPVGILRLRFRPPIADENFAQDDNAEPQICGPIHLGRRTAGGGCPHVGLSTCSSYAPQILFHTPNHPPCDIQP